MKRQIVFLLVAAIMALAVIPDAEAKKGFYVGLGAAYNTIGGDLDGTRGLQGGSEIIILPDIKSAVGIDIRGGYGINNQWAIELNLMSSRHKGDWAGLTKDVTYTSFSVNGKYSLSPSGTVQPYFLVGLSGNSLLIKEGSTNTSTGEVGDATLSGAGFNMGTGLDTYVNPNLSLDLGVLYRVVNYTSASGVNNSGGIDKVVDGSGFSLLLSVAYHF